MIILPTPSTVAGEETITPSAFVTCTLRVRLVPVTVPVDQLSAEYDKRKKELEQKKAEKAKSKSSGKPIEDDEDDEDLDGLNFETEGDGGDGRIFKKKRVQPKVVEAKYYPGVSTFPPKLYCSKLSNIR